MDEITVINSEELSQYTALSLLKRIKDTFSVESHIAEVENIIDEVRKLKKGCRDGFRNNNARIK